MTTTNPTALIAGVTEVRPVRMYPGYMEGRSAQSKIGTVGRYVHGPDSDGDIMVKFPDDTNWYVREWTLASDPVPVVSDEPVLGTARITVTEAFTQRSLVGRDISVRTDMLDTMNDRKWYVSVEADGVSGGNFFRGTPVAHTPLVFTKTGDTCTPDRIPGWRDGLKVRLTGHDSMTRLIGKEGVTATHGGLATVEMSEDGVVNHWANWTRLEVIGETPAPVVPEPVAEDPEVAALQREVERLTRRETDLIAAMVEESQRRGWGDALRVVLEETGLPLAPCTPRIHVDLKRRGGLHLLAPGQDAQVTPDRLIHGQVQWTERVVVTLPEQTGCQCSQGREQIKEKYLTEIKDRLRDLGLGRYVEDEDITILTMRCAYCGG